MCSKKLLYCFGAEAPTVGIIGQMCLQQLVLQGGAGAWCDVVRGVVASRSCVESGIRSSSKKAYVQPFLVHF